MVSVHIIHNEMNFSKDFKRYLNEGKFIFQIKITRKWRGFMHPDEICYLS